MTRRQLIATAFATLSNNSLKPAEDLLTAAARDAKPRAAVLAVREGSFSYLRAFGTAQPDSRFLIASITKPMTASALLWLADRNKVSLDHPASRYLPEFKGEGRDKILLRHLLTHTSGLPDMLPANTALRQRHAPLTEYVKLSLTTPLLFPVDTKYSYSSTGILLAAEIARRVDGRPIDKILAEEIYRPLRMSHTALGLGPWTLKDLVPSQTEYAPADLGSTADSKSWDWNSQYWRSLGSPWGGAHSTASDIATFLDTFLNPKPGGPLTVPTLQKMITNHNPAGLMPYGLGWSLGKRLNKSLSENTFGHGGSVGTLCWADPARKRLFVLLTSLPAAVANKAIIHPVSDEVAAI